jgi:transcriptional regulator with XRE-family HTH domain
MQDHFSRFLLCNNTNERGETMATQLKIARTAAGMTALELARAAGTTENRLFQIERGRFRPRPDEARGLALVLGEPVETLFPGGIQPEGGRNE